MTRQEWNDQFNPPPAPRQAPPQDPLINMPLAAAVDWYRNAPHAERQRLRPTMLLKVKMAAQESPQLVQSLSAKLRGAGLY